MYYSRKLIPKHVAELGAHPFEVTLSDMLRELEDVYGEDLDWTTLRLTIAPTDYIVEAMDVEVKILTKEGS